MVFEVFEASPRREDVLAALDVLQWDFPGAAVAVPKSLFRDDDFVQNLATFFEHVSLESTKSVAMHITKAGSEVAESRDTVDPSLVSSLLVAILEANGRRINPRMVRKRVRDDVLWKNGGMPWRRLPLWLVARVVIQRLLCLRLGETRGRIEYKFFVCVVLKALADRVMFTTSVDRLSHVKSKLCRRLAKLEVDRKNASEVDAAYFDFLFAAFTLPFKTTITQMGDCIKHSVEQFKQKYTRQILPLPRRANGSEVRLSLRASGEYLQRVMSRFRSPLPSQLRTFTRRLRKNSDANAHLASFPDPYFELSKMEKQLSLFCRDGSHGEDPLADISGMIRRYLDAVSTHYDDNAEQKSIMILTTMELWVLLDQYACREYPLLKAYRPTFQPAMLDVLHLVDLAGLERLQAVQNYLRRRLERSDGNRLRIFDDPCEGCFAERFFDHSPHSAALQALYERIEAAADLARETKRQEWLEKSQKYAQLTKAVDESSCIYTVDERNPLGRGYHNDRDCPRCKFDNQRSKMSINVYEHCLPSDPRMIKAVLLELGGFLGLEKYRDTTWHIVARLASPEPGESAPPRCTVQTYSGLEAFVRDNPTSGVVLASVTKPCEFQAALAPSQCTGLCTHLPLLGSTDTRMVVLRTHYGRVSFPVDWQSVDLPCGLRYGYHDRESLTWPGRQRRQPTFEHHCSFRLPFNLGSTSLDGQLGSNEVIANQSECPAGVNVHEYAAVQNLVSGRLRRWITILTELGSSNLNFSAETTSALISRLASHSGPARDDGNPLRSIHYVFSDATFCQKLVEQLSHRLDSLSANWRRST